MNLVNNLAKVSSVWITLNLFFHALPLAMAAVEPLTVSGNQILVGGVAYKGMAGNSFFWSNTGWGAEPFYNANVVAWLKNDWNSKIVRAAMGVEEGGTGYINDPTGNQGRVETVVDAAIANDLYVIIDWHSHHAEQYQSQAITFFQEMSSKYGSYDNVIYEVYNEPLSGVSWSGTIKPYAEAVIAAIRANDPDNLIVVGTPTWSQDVISASNDPITSYPNIAYALHFYAGTHGQSLRNNADSAMNNGIALMVTEWGTVNANGDGGVATSETNAWVSWMKQHGLFHLNWSVHDKNEGASIVYPGSDPNGGWSSSDLTASGSFVRDIMIEYNNGTLGGGGGSFCEDVSIPGLIQAETYCTMFGVQTETTTDTGGGENIGYIENNDWVEYNITVATSGPYTINARVASDNAGGTIDFLVDTGYIGSVTVSNTGGWQSWVTETVDVTLQAGTQTLRLDFYGSGDGLFNINWLDIVQNGPIAPTTSPTPSPTATPVTTTSPTPSPTAAPVVTTSPTSSPTAAPVITTSPTSSPTAAPVITASPTSSPTRSPVTPLAETGELLFWTSEEPGPLETASCEYAGTNALLNAATEGSTWLDPYITPKMYCGGSGNLYENGLGCGKCYRIAYDGVGGGSADVQIVNSGAGGVNGFQCFSDAFQQISGATSGTYDITFTEIPCTYSPPTVVMMEPNDNAWYTKVLVAGGTAGVSAVDLILDGQTLSMTRNSGATWWVSLQGQSNVGASYLITYADGTTASVTNCYDGQWPVPAGSQCSGSSPVATPTGTPTASPTRATDAPTAGPTAGPTVTTDAPTSGPTVATDAPTAGPTAATNAPTKAPTPSPTSTPTQATGIYTNSPTKVTDVPTNGPTEAPTNPTSSPTASPPTDGSTGVHCVYDVRDDWDVGFTVEVYLTNAGTEPVNGWTVTFEYGDGTTLNNSWNGVFSGNDPYTVTPMNYNFVIYPGSTVSFGMVGQKGTPNSSAIIPVLEGPTCESRR